MKRGAFVLGLLAVLCCGCVSPQLYALFGDESKLPPMEDSGLPKVE